jgi:hypothetical protein
MPEANKVRKGLLLVSFWILNPILSLSGIKRESMRGLFNIREYPYISLGLNNQNFPTA